MITNNAKNFFLSFAQQFNVTVKNIANGMTTVNYTKANCMWSFCGAVAASASQINSLAHSTATLDVGFGDTPESDSDYVLADGNTANPMLTPVGFGKNTPSLGIICSIYANFRNDTNSNVIVKEIGMYGNPTENASSAGSATVLYFRKVLDTPITIAPGETYSFTYTVRFKNS